MKSFLLIAMFSLGQPQAPLPQDFPAFLPQAPQVKVSLPSYWDAQSQAIREKRLLLTYYRCEPVREFLQVVTCRTNDELPGFGVAPRLIVSKPAGDVLVWVADLSPDATVADINRAVRGRAEVQASPAPFPDLYGKAKWYHRLAALDRVDDNSLKGIGLVPYTSAKLTQQTFDRELTGIRGNALISVVSRYHPGLPSKWHQPGGMEGISGGYSNVYKSVAGVNEWRGPMRPWEQFSPVTFQRSYEDGTLFVDMLSTDSGYFEGRAAEKVGGQWIRYVFQRDKRHRPAGYVGLRGQSCINCHGSLHDGGPGSGDYGGPEVPGGDTIVSDKLSALER